MSKKKKMLLIIALVGVFLCGLTFIAQAVPANIDIPKVNVTIDGKSQSSPTEYVSNIKLLILLTLLTLLPSFIIMMTSFTRIAVVLSFLKGALGVQQSIPNQILIGLAIFLSIFIMQPVYTQINDNALKPYMEGTINQDKAIEEGSKPLRQFMLKQTRQKDLKLFLEAAGMDKDENITMDNVSLTVVVPAFVISELKTAFQIGFLLYIPFMLIDLVVASILLSMGMMMLPPVMISLPFKLLLFVMVDGWYLLVKSMILSFM